MTQKQRVQLVARSLPMQTLLAQAEMEMCFGLSGQIPLEAVRCVAMAVCTAVVRWQALLGRDRGGGTAVLLAWQSIMGKRPGGPDAAEMGDMLLGAWEDARKDREQYLSEVQDG
jgi:hypothetical protein